MIHPCGTSYCLGLHQEQGGIKIVREPVEELCHVALVSHGMETYYRKREHDWLAHSSAHAPKAHSVLSLLEGRCKLWIYSMIH